MRLAEDRFYNKYKCIVITGKGQPDVATRLFLHKIRAQLKLPVLALVDSDPYGLKVGRSCGSPVFFNLPCAGFPVFLVYILRASSDSNPLSSFNRYLKPQPYLTIYFRF